MTERLDNIYNFAFEVIYTHLLDTYYTQVHIKYSFLFAIGNLIKYKVKTSRLWCRKW